MGIVFIFIAMVVVILFGKDINNYGNHHTWVYLAEVTASVMGIILVIVNPFSSNGRRK